jgi:phospholipid/cholesterol/gamma-HCH transport system substrate-binding protein
MSVETKVGAFVLSGLVLLGISIFLLGDFTFENRYDLYVVFSDVANLSKDAPVKLSGVEVGQVQDIVLENSHARVITKIRKDIDIYRNAEFAIGSTGIIGSKYLQVDQGKPSSGKFQDGDTAQGTDPLSIERSLTKALSSLTTMINDLNGDGPRGSITKNLRDTVANVRELTANLNDLIETTRPSLEKTMSRADAITEKLDSLLEKSNQMMAGLSSDKGAVGALLHDEKVKADVKETIASVKEAAGTAKDVFGRITQFRVHWNYDWRYEHAIKSSRIDIGLKISPRDGRYYYVGGSNLANISDEQGSGGRVDYAQKNRVDALLGWEKGPFDFAAGVIRSGGGGRVTYTPFHNDALGKRFSVMAQAYDFGRNRIVEGRRMDKPNVDFGVMARLHRFLGVGARVEDVKEVARYQTWVNVAFEDKDIAYLFGMVSFGAAGSKGRSKSN